MFGIASVVVRVSEVFDAAEVRQDVIRWVGVSYVECAASIKCMSGTLDVL